MAKKTKTQKTAKVEKPTGKAPYLSNTVCPPKMTLEQWQIQLRRQAALKENFAISEESDTDEHGCYRLISPRSHQIYKIVYRGEGSPWNYCSCMDFKSNQLSTCKHVEAVKLWLSAKGQVPDASLPSYTSVYLSYAKGRKVCIRVGSEKREEFLRLASEYFTDEFVLRPNCIYSFFTFLSRARKICDTFRCYSDAYQYILDLRDSKRREALVEESAVMTNLTGC